MKCTPILDAQGRQIGWACSRGQRAPQCSTPGCHGRGVAQCDHPVVRNGKPGTCDRWLCSSCRRHRPDLGKDRDLCGPHDATTPRAQAELPIAKRSR